MSDRWLDDTRRSYDTDASGYADQVRGLLAAQPRLRAELDLFAEQILADGGGPVADLGCGPGYVTDHLVRAGLDAFGLDLSPELIALAEREYPDRDFRVGTMTDLELDDASLAGAVAFWSIVHIPDHAMPGVCHELVRVLRPGASVLVGFHVGAEVQHSAEGYSGRPIALDGYRRQPEQVCGWLRDAGLTIDAVLVLRPDDPVPGALICAHRPTSAP